VSRPHENFSISYIDTRGSVVAGHLTDLHPADRSAADLSGGVAESFSIFSDDSFSCSEGFESGRGTAVNHGLE
jgi:hypothetical protein